MSSFKMVKAMLGIFLLCCLGGYSWFKEYAKEKKAAAVAAAEAKANQELAGRLEEVLKNESLSRDEKVKAILHTEGLMRPQGFRLEEMAGRTELSLKYGSIGKRTFQDFGMMAVPLSRLGVHSIYVRAGKNGGELLLGPLALEGREVSDYLSAEEIEQAYSPR